MKKIVVRGVIGIISLILIVLAGCNNAILAESEKYVFEGERTSPISKRVGYLKEAGLLDPLLMDRTARSVSEMYFNDMDKVNYFISNTDEALAEIAQLENGDVQLRLIDALFTGGTVGEIADIMAEISEDMANEYLTAMETQLNILSESKETLGRSAVSVGEIRNTRLNFYDEKNIGTMARGAYAANLNWDTIAWYSGFCAATVAGV